MNTAGQGHAARHADRTRMESAISKAVERLEGRVLLAASPSVSIDLDSPASPLVAVGDVTGDGIPDIVSLEQETRVTLTTQKGRPVVTTETVSSWHVNAGNRQGGYDLVKVKKRGDELPLTAADGTPTAIAVGDVDGDGFGDLVVLTQGSGPNGQTQVVVLQGDGKGGAGGGAGGQLRKTFVLPHVLESSGRLAVGDLDGDGLAEIVVAGQLSVGGALVPGGGIVSSRLASSPGGGMPVVRFLLPAVQNGFTEVSGLDIASFTGDGHAQLAVWGDPHVDDRFFTFDLKTGLSELAVDYGVKSPRDSASGLATGRRMAAGDVNGDGAADIVWITDGPDRNDLSVFVGVSQGVDDGSGARTLSFSWGVCNTPSSLMKAKEKANRTRRPLADTLFLADADGDGSVDLLALTPNGGSTAAEVSVFGFEPQPLDAAAFALKKHTKTGHVTLLK